MSAKHFQQDCLEIALADLKAGRISRRSFLGASALMGASPMLLSAGNALAQDKPAQVVHANWGGDATTCTTNFYGATFEKETGVKVVVDGSGPLEGNIKAMVEAGNVTWDCCDADFFNVLRLSQAGQLEASKTWLERAWDLSEDPEVAAHLGETLWRMGRPADAKRVWEDALADNPDSPPLKRAIERRSQ